MQSVEGRARYGTLLVPPRRAGQDQGRRAALAKAAIADQSAPRRSHPLIHNDPRPKFTIHGR